MDYSPVDPEKYEQMLKLMRHAANKQELESATLLYLFDMSYARADINQAVHVVAKEKGIRL